MVENGNAPINQVSSAQKKGWMRWLIPLIILAVFGFWGYWYWNKNLRYFVSTDDAFLSADRVAISSKILGRISRLSTDEGKSVQEGQPILSIYNLNQIWVTANLEETKLSRIQLQSPVEIHIDTYPERNFSGKVSLIGDYTASEFSLIPPNNAAGNFTKITQRVPLKIILDKITPEENQKYPLRPGMSAEIKIKIQ